MNTSKVARVLPKPKHMARIGLIMMATGFRFYALNIGAATKIRLPVFPQTTGIPQVVAVWIR